jgi:hypothetical protein
MIPNLSPQARLPTMPRSNPNTSQSLPRPSPPRPANGGFNYERAHADRLRRYEARERRRDGDWEILEFPMAFLWLGDTCVPGPFGEFECVTPVMVDLWP